MIKREERVPCGSSNICKTLPNAAITYAKQHCLPPAPTLLPAITAQVQPHTHIHAHKPVCIFDCVKQLLVFVFRLQPVTVLSFTLAIDDRALPPAVNTRSTDSKERIWITVGTPCQRVLMYQLMHERRLLVGCVCRLKLSPLHTLTHAHILKCQSLSSFCFHVTGSVSSAVSAPRRTTHQLISFVGKQVACDQYY